MHTWRLLERERVECGKFRGKKRGNKLAEMMVAALVINKPIHPAASVVH